MSKPIRLGLGNLRRPRSVHYTEINRTWREETNIFASLTHRP
jgi:hypothetical protein